nr:hypothetical protein [Pectobacterium brasiliense]
MLYSLGIRGGELLNITIPDIDFQERCYLSEGGQMKSLIHELDNHW